MKNRPFTHRLIAAWNGISYALKNERSFRTQCIGASAAILLLVAVRPAPLWWAAFGLSIGGVLGFELMNTALEALLDRLIPKPDPTVRIAKDCAAGAVLVMSIVSLVVLASLVVSSVYK